MSGTKSSHLAGRRFGAYEIRVLLGAGGMGDVYRAHDRRLGRDVALKTLPAEFAHDLKRLARFRREARTLAALNHPNIAAIYGIDEFENHTFLVLDLVEGDTLAESLTRSGRIPLEASTIFDMALKRARALVTRLEEEPHVNPISRTREFSLRDPDGYYVTIRACLQAIRRCGALRVPEKRQSPVDQAVR